MQVSVLPYLFLYILVLFTLSSSLGVGRQGRRAFWLDDRQYLSISYPQSVSACSFLFLIFSHINLPQLDNPRDVTLNCTLPLQIPALRLFF